MCQEPTEYTEQERPTQEDEATVDAMIRAENEGRDGFMAAQEEVARQEWEAMQGLEQDLWDRACIGNSNADVYPYCF